MKNIKLNKTNVAQVDDDVYNFIIENKLNFHSLKIGNNIYAACDLSKSKDENKPKMYLYLHRLVFVLKNGIMPKMVDHKDRNGLNCQISNLREATRSQNLHNQRTYNKHGYQGIWYDKKNNRYYAEIMKDGIKYKPGSSKDIKIAVDIYNKKALELYGEYARLNKI